MNAEELMLWNIVTIDNPKVFPELKGSPFIVTGINHSVYEPKIGYETVVSLRSLETKEYYSQLVKYIEPIPITAEWLDKFGFEYSMQYSFHKVPEFGDKSRLMITNGTIGLNARPLGVGGINDDFKFIHEIQNHFQVNHKIKLEIK